MGANGSKIALTSGAASVDDEILEHNQTEVAAGCGKSSETDSNERNLSEVFKYPSSSVGMRQVRITSITVFDHCCNGTATIVDGGVGKDHVHVKLGGRLSKATGSL